MAKSWGPTDGEWTTYLGTGAVISQLTVHVIQDGEVYSLTFDAKETAGGHILTGGLYADVKIEYMTCHSCESGAGMTTP